MAPQLIGLTTVAKDQSSVPRTYFRGLTTTYKSDSRASNACFWPPMDILTHLNKPTYLSHKTDKNSFLNNGISEALPSEGAAVSGVDSVRPKINL